MKRFKKYKLLLFEICETLETICLTLAEITHPYGKSNRNVFALRDHARALRLLSKFLVGREEDEEH